MIEDLTIRNYSPRTIKIYLDRVAKFAQHFGQSPDRLGPEHIREFQLFLVQRKKASWTQYNQSVCALRFFYRVCLGKTWMIEHIPFPKQPKRLPVVLSRQEVQRLFEAVANLKRSGSGPDRLPHGRPWGTPPAMSHLRPRANRLQLLPQPTLPQVPGAEAGRLAPGTVRQAA